MISFARRASTARNIASRGQARISCSSYYCREPAERDKTKGGKKRIIEAVENSKMDTRHDNLNALLDETE
jgi:hypothetical protein